MEKKEKPKRKLPKKSQRPKRRYILFSLEKGSCTGKQAFDVLMSCFSLEERKSFGIWFIEFDPKTGLGIVKCKLSSLEETKKGFEKIPKKFDAKTVKTSGTLKALKAK